MVTGVETGLTLDSKLSQSQSIVQYAYLVQHRYSGLAWDGLTLHHIFLDQLT